MSNYLEEKIEKMAKSIFKKIKEKSPKTVIADVLDNNTQEEVHPDDIVTGRQSSINLHGQHKVKNNKSEHLEKKQGVPKESDPEVHERCVKKVKAKGNSKSSAFAICNEAKAGQTQKNEHFVENLIKNFKIISNAYLKKKEKPFHGYNKEKHSTEGGLSKKGREKINREEGSNLKAPVSAEAAKKSPKKAKRRKSFCARMSGVKGPTSKEGKLTRKGAALKRWDCN
jgi:hypothetical protein